MPKPISARPDAVPGRSDPLAFWRAWLRSPAGIGAVAPSGRALARAMARATRAVRDSGDGAVVELGAGTGSVTRALLEAGIAPSRLIVIEREPALARILSGRFPGLNVLARDARDLPAILAEHGRTHADVVVSSLPLLAMPRPMRSAIVAAAAAALRPGGRIVQFTYGPASPLGDLAPEAGLCGRRDARAWLNLPPATVWCYEHDAATNGQAAQPRAEPSSGMTALSGRDQATE